MCVCVSLQRTGRPYTSLSLTTCWACRRLQHSVLLPSSTLSWHSAFFVSRIWDCLHSNITNTNVDCLQLNRQTIDSWIRWAIYSPSQRDRHARPSTDIHRCLEFDVGQLGDTLAPLRRIVGSQAQLLTTPLSHENWAPFSSLNEDYWAVTNSLQAMEKTKALLKTEISFRRLGPQDTSQLLLSARKASTAASGFIRFHLLVTKHLSVPVESATPTLDDFTLHIAPSQPASRMPSPPTSPHRSRVSSAAAQNIDELPYINPTESGRPLSEESEQQQLDGSTSHRSRKASSSPIHRRQPSTGPFSPNNSSFLAHLMSTNAHRKPVGVYMSSRYAQLENLMSRPDDAQTIQSMVDSLHDLCDGLLYAMGEGLEHITLALQLLKSSSPIKAFQGRARITKDVVDSAQKAQSRLEAELKRFHAQRGHAFDTRSTSKPSVRALFWSLLYQYSIQTTAEQIVDLLAIVRTYETENNKTQLYYPSLSILFRTSRLETDAYEDDPDFIAGLRASKTMRETPRDPDRLPPDSVAQVFGHYVYLWLSYLGRKSQAFLVTLF